MISLAIGLQVVFGALITGISAAASNPRIAQVSTAVLGGACTICASYLARVRGNNDWDGEREKLGGLEVGWGAGEIRRVGETHQTDRDNAS
jgi:hypothetical protein